MTLGDIIKPENIIPELEAGDRWEAIDELVNRLVVSGDLDEAQRGPVLAAVRKRENSMSTGIGFGIGIPHASSDVLRRLVAAFGRSKKGVEFEALDAQPVSLVVLFLVPQGEFQPHLHTLATIAKMLHRREVRQELEDAPDAAAIHAVISKHSHAG
ncbi:MAG: PTS sugar transporter subunit IIA [Verrucomicrobiae bacterium]|nr:PTS sugar transporter subunit IIA [Verrucomicrobiae bacterium]MCP5522223.1 PTS sugar transporter subunit IIA [Verrucomicrobiales bacterium]